jgi:hypothetical protein
VKLDDTRIGDGKNAPNRFKLLQNTMQFGGVQFGSCNLIAEVSACSRDARKRAKLVVFTTL